MKKHIGEIQGIGTQVVLPGSINKDGKEYKVYKDLPIKEISEEQLNTIKQKYSKTFEVKSPNWSNYSQTPISEKLSITSFVNTSNLKSYKDEYYGEHPIHGSNTGMNFFMNPNKNLWHCFRHDSGGDSLSYLSIVEGICDCEDFSLNGKRLRGEDFKKTLKIAKDKYGLVLEDYDLEKIKIITDRELSEIEFDEIDWVVKDLIPGVSLVLIAGKTGAMKSILTTYMAFCCCYGLDFLGKYPTKNTKWLYFDEENPKRITQSRNDIIRRGLGVEPTEEFGYLLHAGLKLVGDKKSIAIQTIINFIKQFKPDVIVLDSLVRFLGAATNENAAGDISEIFTNLRQISIDEKVTFIIIHHMNKAPDKKGVDRVRGSTDIVNAVDIALLFDRDNPTSPFINISQEKNRYDSEQKPFTVMVNSNKIEQSLSFDITDTPTQDKDKNTQASEEVSKWLQQREWESEDKEFKTSDVLEQFSNHFDDKSERNRKIIQGALKCLIEKEVIIRLTKGVYQYIILEENYEDEN
jgi:RecA-family ATPase